MRFATFSATSDGHAGSADSAEASCVAQLEVAEAQGYAAAWIGGGADGAGGLSPSQHVIGAALSARTTRIRIGMASALEPSLHPLRFAEEIAMLDVMSGGRFDWAVGPGPDAGAPSPDRTPEANAHTTRGARLFREQLAITLQALTGERFSHEGEFFQIPQVQCFPPPVQSPHPPLFVRAESEEELAWATSAGLPRVVGPATPANARGARVVIRHVHVGATDARAREEAEPMGCAIVGDFARCRDALEELVERAAPELLVAWHGFGALPREAALASQRRLIEDVAPDFG